MKTKDLVMTETDIRTDFENVKGQISRLVGLGIGFRENDDQWAHLKNREDFDKVYALDAVLQNPLKEIYATGRDCALHMSEHLLNVNRIDVYPTLTAAIASFDNTWVYQTDMLQKRLDAAREANAHGNAGLWSIGQMISLFEQQIEYLVATENTLNMLRKSDLYKMENNKEVGKTSKVETVSENQSGGITAHTVNIGSVNGDFGEKSPRIEGEKINKSLWRYLGYLAAFATIVGVVWQIFYS